MVRIAIGLCCIVAAIALWSARAAYAPQPKPLSLPADVGTPASGTISYFEPSIAGCRWMRHLPEGGHTDELAVFASSCSAGRIALSRDGRYALASFGTRRTGWGFDLEEPAVAQLHLMDFAMGTSTELRVPGVRDSGSSLAGFGSGSVPVLIREEWHCSLLQTLLALDNDDESCNAFEVAYEWRSGWVRLREQSDSRSEISHEFSRALPSFAEIRNNTLPNGRPSAWTCQRLGAHRAGEWSCVLRGPSIRITRTRTDTCTGSYLGPIAVAGTPNPAFALIGAPHQNVESEGDLILVTTSRERERPTLVDAWTGRVVFQATNGLGAFFWPDAVHPLDR